MVQTKVFKSNQSQAVRLPKAVSFPETVKEVSVIAIGKSRIIAPVEQTWDDWFNEPVANSDFMQNREQPNVQQRESLNA